MYVNRLDDLIDFLNAEFADWTVSENFVESDSLDAPELKKGLITVIMGPAHSFGRALSGQAPTGKQIIQILWQKALAESTKGGVLQRAELALMESIKSLQNSPNLPNTAAGLVLKDIINSQQALRPRMEVLATFEVTDHE